MAQDQPGFVEIHSQCSMPADKRVLQEKPSSCTEVKRLCLEGTMHVKRLRSEAIMPVRGSAQAAGFDLAAAEGTVIPARSHGLVKTGLSIAIPWGTYARIAARSGLAVRRQIDVGAGVVDYDYRGEVGVVLFNHGDEVFGVKPGDRVAQLILEKIAMSDCVEVDDLDKTVRVQMVLAVQEFRQVVLEHNFSSGSGTDWGHYLGVRSVPTSECCLIKCALTWGYND